MDWLNLHTSILDSPEVIGSDPIDRGTWLMLLRFCIGQENSGRIDACRDWKDRKWQQLVRVTKKEIESECDLWSWDEDSLIVSHYPLQKESEVRLMRDLGRLKSPAKQAAAKANGTLGGRPRKNPTENPTENPTAEPNKTQLKTHIRERKGKEEKGKEGNKDDEPASPDFLNQNFEDETSETEQSFGIADIVAFYPRKQRTADACEEIRRHIKNGVSPLAIINGTKAIAAVIQTLPSGALNQFVPSALTFFRDRLWEDDPRTWLRKATGPNGATHAAPLEVSGRKATVIRINSNS